jgi:hypothetical protein
MDMGIPSFAADRGMDMSDIAGLMMDMVTLAAALPDSAGQIFGLDF